MRQDNRALDALRPVKMTPGYVTYPEGSVLIEMGETRVLCNASVLEQVPPWLAGTGRGRDPAAPGPFQPRRNPAFQCRRAQHVRIAEPGQAGALGILVDAGLQRDRTHRIGGAARRPSDRRHGSYSRLRRLTGHSRRGGRHPTPLQAAASSGRGRGTSAFRGDVDTIGPASQIADRA